MYCGYVNGRFSQLEHLLVESSPGLLRIHIFNYYSYRSLLVDFQRSCARCLNLGRKI